MTLPADIVNRALDIIGCQNTLGDLQEGTTEAKAALRVYGPTLRQISRAAHWNFLRKQASLTLLQDATGQTTAQQQSAGQPVTVGTGTIGMRPWIYEYAWPTDGLLIRWMPAAQYPVSPGAPLPPLMTGLAQRATTVQVPTRFLVGQDNVPPLVGVPTAWNQMPDLQGIQGRGRATQTVILTNQPQAAAVYTCLITEPDEWDPLFQQAMVAVLGSFLAMPCLPDKKMAMSVRAQQIVAAKAALDQARVSDGDEGWNTTDHTPDWMKTRNNGGGRWGYGGAGYGAGPGGWWGSWSACGFGDGSAY